VVRPAQTLGPNHRQRYPLQANAVRPLIPTSSKDRLPNFVAYPVNAKQISSAFCSLAQYDRMQLSFNCKAIHDIAREDRVSVVSVHYSNHGRLWHLDPHVDENAEGNVWGIMVDSVPRQFNARVRTGLIGSGLPILAKWISRHRSEIWYTTKHICVLYYSSNDDSFITAESDL